MVSKRENLTSEAARQQPGDRRGSFDYEMPSLREGISSLRMTVVLTHAL